jgi:cell division protein FtsW (lipid II flippase)
MSRRWQLAAGGIAVALVLWIAGVSLWVPILIVLAALAVPVTGYLMLDSNQRKRVKRIRDRRQIR